MSEPTAPGDQPGGHLRVSDVDRQAVVDRLSKATGEGLLNLEEFADAAGAAYAAVTRAELDAVTRDLHLPVLLPPPTMPAPQARSAPAPAAAPATAPAPAGEPVDWVVAVMGGEQRRGRWRARRRTTAVAVMGGIDLDLREAVLEGDVIEITAWAVMGGVDIIVPEGVAVEFTGFVLMGGRTNRVKHVESTPDTPVIRVKGYGMWGGVTVRSRRPRQAGDVEAAGRAARDFAAGFLTPPPVPRPPRPPVPPHRHRHHRDEPVPAPAPPQPAATGSLVTVVCTDIVGSTRYADTLGDQRWRTVLLDHNALVRQHLARHGGTEVKNTGDGFLMTFPGARSALQFAVGLQDGLTTWRETHPETPLEVRIGVHAGEVETDGHDLVGRNVTIACRLCDAAAPGEVLASAVVADLADSASDLEFGDAREHHLAGIERPLVARAAPSLTRRRPVADRSRGGRGTVRRWPRPRPPQIPPQSRRRPPPARTRWRRRQAPPSPGSPSCGSSASSSDAGATDIERGMVRTDHVNLPVPPGSADEVATFYEVVLGFTRAQRPDTGRAGAWLDVGDGVQVHLSEREGGPHPDQHVAFVVDDLDAIRGRAAGAGVDWDEMAPGRAKFRDPAGNLVELFAEGAARA